MDRLLEVLEKSLNFTHTCLYEPCNTVCLYRLTGAIAAHVCDRFTNSDVLAHLFCVQPDAVPDDMSDFGVVLKEYKAWKPDPEVITTLIVAIFKQVSSS